MATKSPDVERVLKAKPKDYFAVLAIDVATAEYDDVKKSYKTISLAIHPDKCTDPKAKDAFAVVAAAYEHLNDEKNFQRYKDAWARKNNARAAAEKLAGGRPVRSAEEQAAENEARQREETYKAAVREYQEREAKQHRAETEKAQNEEISKAIETQLEQYAELKTVYGSSILTRATGKAGGSNAPRQR